MKESNFNHDKPKNLEAKRIAEIKKLTYAERLERFLKLMELSYALKNAPKVYPNNK